MPKTKTKGVSVESFSLEGVSERRTKIKGVSVESFGYEQMDIGVGRQGGRHFVLTLELFSNNTKGLSKFINALYSIVAAMKTRRMYDIKISVKESRKEFIREED